MCYVSNRQQITFYFISKVCETFYYSGCQGNENNLLNKTDYLNGSGDEFFSCKSSTQRMLRVAKITLVDSVAPSWASLTLIIFSPKILRQLARLPVSPNRNCICDVLDGLPNNLKLNPSWNDSRVADHPPKLSILPISKGDDNCKKVTTKCFMQYTIFFRCCLKFSLFQNSVFCLN